MNGSGTSAGLGLFAAATWGGSDFVGGLGARRAPAILVVASGHIVSFLLRAGIPVQETPPQAARMPEPPTDMSKMRMNKEEIDAAGQDYAADEHDMYDGPDTTVKRTPVQAGPKIGRNDPCPCGSGKKYKACHGKGL